jgi:alpha-ribazole phosphatase/probable phosphoglycerate mutase
MLTIIFEAHGTTFDNEAHLASGHNDVALSPLGESQARELGARYNNDHFEAIFCSDLQRSYKTAEIAFAGLLGVGPLTIKDARFRECDYGDMTQYATQVIDAEKPKRITTPFPNGESYTETNARMKEFLDEIAKNYDGKRVMIIGHRATQYALDFYIKNIPLEQSVSTPFKWQPGWEYELN